jgi:hypothetical protein
LAEKVFIDSISGLFLDGCARAGADESLTFYCAVLAPSNQTLGKKAGQKKAQPMWLRRIHQRRRVEETNPGTASNQPASSEPIPLCNPVLCSASKYCALPHRIIDASITLIYS